MTEAGKTTLTMVPALRAGRTADGHVVLPRKFADGLAEFRRFWPGPMKVYMAQGPENTGNLDDTPFLPSQLPCEVAIVPDAEFAKTITADQRSVVLLSLDDFRQTQLSAACHERKIPCAYVTEYSIRTRHQIADLTSGNPLRRIRRRVWESQQERLRKKAVTFAAGLQCNGTPTYNDYRNLCSDALLYFDTRVTADMLASDDEVSRKSMVGAPPRPIQLLFSGRLARMKGVMQLIDVAKALRKLKVDFQLGICGDGEQKGELAKRIQEENLAQFVSLKGTMNFATELMPYVKSSVDLFVCCHPQGDPSCTYLETMSCGVPIVGYANEAFEGVVALSKAGWLVPLNRPDLMAAEIARIQQHPEELSSMSHRALSFAREHTFEQTFTRRADHLQALAY